MGGGGLFGGGGGGTTYNVAQPPAPAPIDYDKMYAAATRSAIQQMQEQERSLERLYPKMIAQQLGTARQVAGELDNQYLARTRGVMDQELQAASAPSAIEAELQRRAQADLVGGPTAIQRQLRDDAQRDLALGQSLSSEEQRNAQQAARGAFAARGLGTSAGSSAAEILNRDAYGRQRQDQRRQFAMGAEQYFTGAEDARRAQALGANQLDLARRGRRIILAEGYGALDPFARGLNPAFGLGQATMGQGTQLIGNTFNNAVNQAGNVESFNRNLQGSMYNSAMNNQAAIQGANMQAGAMRQAGMMNMIGNIGSSILSDKREKKDIKPLGSAGKVLGLTAYEFKYKEQGAGSGEPGAKHVGFLAQDVKKVLPEAVEEVNYRGKKRLAIKPAVIGAALAQELTQAKAA